MSVERVAVVTGAGSGINRGVAELLGSEMTIAACDIAGDAAEETAAKVRDAGGKASAWTMDVADRGAVKDVVDRIAAEHGQIDVLVNGAGYAQFVDFLDMTDEQWGRMLDVHLTGTFNCTQAVVGHMRERNYGRIVCFSSVGALSGSPKHSHYAAAKAGVIGFSKALCKEIGPWGITINCVAPGAIETPMLGEISQEAYDRYAATPVGRIGQPADVAHAIRYLTSEEAGFVTGWVLSINGGFYS